MLVMLYGASGRLWPAAHMATFAIPLVFFIYCNRPLCDVLASAPCRFLGKISFPLYLVQFAVFISFTAWAIERAAAAQMLSLPVALAIAALSVAASLAAAWLFLPVERFTHRQGNWLARRMLASD